MYANFNESDPRFGGHRDFDGQEGFGGPRAMPRHHGGFDDNPRAMPRCPGHHGGPATMPRHFGGHDFGGPGNPGFPPHGMGPGFPGMPPFGGRGPGRPPRRPDPRFLRQRLEEADLAELIDMAGRMLRRRPQGGPAQGQALVLSILLGRETLSQRELQQMLGIQPGSLSELVGKLEAKGYLTREKAEDRRGNLLRITDAGREAALAHSDDGAGADPFAPLTADQQDTLAASLRTLLTAWVGEMTEAPLPLGQKPVEV